MEKIFQNIVYLNYYTVNLSTTYFEIKEIHRFFLNVNTHSYLLSHNRESSLPVSKEMLMSI